MGPSEQLSSLQLRSLHAAAILYHLPLGMRRIRSPCQKSEWQAIYSGREGAVNEQLLAYSTTFSEPGALLHPCLIAEAELATSVLYYVVRRVDA
jgi:hypothetical protein